MKTTKTLLAAVTLSVGLLSATGANAALESALGGQVVNDTELGITWLADANLAASNTSGGAYSVYNWELFFYVPFAIATHLNNQQRFAEAQSWIGAMNTANYLGFNDWRLPTSYTCIGYSCTGDERYLPFEGAGAISSWQFELPAVYRQFDYSTLDDLALLQSVQSLNFWSGTEYAPNPFDAWAVRPGQVVSAVPEPETYAMLLAGLGLIGFMARGRGNNFAA